MIIRFWVRCWEKPRISKLLAKKIIMRGVGIDIRYNATG